MKEYQLKIFETNKNDGIMSSNKKFYPTEYSEEDIQKAFFMVRSALGKKYHFDGLKILQPKQKDVEFIEEYPNGKYVKIKEKNLQKEDFWQESIPADILMIDTNNPNIVIGHRHADCPVVIAEDRKHQLAAVAHCGALQINREVPKYIIEALKNEGSNVQNIYVYIGSCIKKDSYKYDCYPKWATREDIWKNNIEKHQEFYYIDLIGAIKEQLAKEEVNMQNIHMSPYDTYKSDEFYSHAASMKEINSKKGQNFVGCFYQEKE